MSCKDCVFCKKALISDYVKGAEFYKCDMDGEMILDPLNEGDECAWFKAINKRHISLKKKITNWISRILLININ